MLCKLAHRTKSGEEQGGEMGYMLSYECEREKKGKYHIRKKDAIQKDKVMTKVRKRVWKKEKQAWNINTGFV